MPFQSKFSTPCQGGAILLLVSLSAALLPSILAAQTRTAPAPWTQAAVGVTRLERDRYQVVKTDIIVHTKHCHAYTRGEEAIITTREQGEENLIYFANGDVCEIVQVERPSDRRFALLDFLIQLGLLAANAKGIPVPKR